MSSVGMAGLATVTESRRQCASMKVWRMSAYEPIRLEGKLLMRSPRCWPTAGAPGTPGACGAPGAGVCAMNWLKSKLRGPTTCTVCPPRSRPRVRSLALVSRRTSEVPRKIPPAGSTRATAKPWARSDSRVASGIARSFAPTCGVTYWFQCAPGAAEAAAACAALSIGSAASMKAGKMVLPAKSKRR